MEIPLQGKLSIAWNPLVIEAGFLRLRTILLLEKYGIISSDIMVRLAETNGNPSTKVHCCNLKLEAICTFGFQSQEHSPFFNESRTL